MFGGGLSDVTKEHAESSIDGDATRSATKEDVATDAFHNLSPRNGGD